MSKKSSWILTILREVFMCKEEMSKEYYHRCCDQGPQGVPGLQGEQGVQGVQGQQGVPGQTGTQGIQGLQGQKGECHCEDCPDRGCKCCEAYANIWSQPPQFLGPFGSANDSVIFQNTNAVSAPDFDLSMMSTDGSIKLLKAGVYRINYGVEAKVAQPIPVPVPVPSFSFGLWNNGSIVPGSTISGYTQAPGDDTIQITGEVTIVIAAHDVIKLRNASSNGVDMNPNTVGIVFPVTVATMNINCLKMLP